MAENTQTQKYPNYSDERLNQIVGDIINRINGLPPLK